MLQCVAVRCSALQYVLVSCHVVVCVTVCDCILHLKRDLIRRTSEATLLFLPICVRVRVRVCVLECVGVCVLV